MHMCIYIYIYIYVYMLGCFETGIINHCLVFLRGPGLPGLGFETGIIQSLFIHRPAEGVR